MVRLLKVLFILVVMLVLAVVALVVTFDPNKYKPELIDAAGRNHVLLRIDGDLSWQLWPRLAIKAAKVSVAAPDKPDATIASIESFAVALQIKPLFSRQVVMDGIQLSGAAIQLSVNKSGKGNWQSLGRVAMQSEEPTLRYASATPLDAIKVRSVSAEPAFDLAHFQLARLGISDSQLSFKNAEGLKLDLRELNAELTQLQFNGSAIPVQLDTQFSVERPEAATLAGNTRIALDLTIPPALDLINLEKVKATTQMIQGGTTADVVMDANATLLLGRATGAGPSYSGSVALAPLNLQKLMIALGSPLPPMAGAEALHRVSLQTPFAGDAKTVQFAPLTLKVDDTQIAGSAAITDIETLALRVDIQGDHIDLDSYLAPPEALPQGGGTQQKAAPKAAPDDALPLEALRALSLELVAGFDQMTAKKLQFSAVKTKASAHAGLINLQSFDARLHDAPITANAIFDARQSIATLNFKAVGEKMALEKLLADFEVQPLVSGLGGVVVVGQAKGATSTALADSFQADISLTSQQMLLHNMNLERSLCELAMLAQRQEMPAIAWSESTKLQSLTSTLFFADNKLTIKQLNSGVESMAMAGLGMVDLNKNALDFKFNLRIDEAANKLLQCPIANKKLLNRDIPVRCKDSFAKLNARSCAPDMAMLNDLYGDEIKQKIGKQLDKQLQDNPELNNLLKDLLSGKKKKKKNDE